MQAAAASTAAAIEVIYNYQGFRKPYLIVPSRLEAPWSHAPLGDIYVLLETMKRVFYAFRVS